MRPRSLHRKSPRLSEDSAFALRFCLLLKTDGNSVSFRLRGRNIPLLFLNS